MVKKEDIFCDVALSDFTVWKYYITYRTTRHVSILGSLVNKDQNSDNPYEDMVDWRGGMRQAPKVKKLPNNTYEILKLYAANFDKIDEMRQFMLPSEESEEEEK